MCANSLNGVNNSHAILHASLYKWVEAGGDSYECSGEARQTHTHTLHEIIDSSPKFLQDDKFERRGQRRWNLGRTG